jgi:tetratricopeptide (TPR) repeat protein
MRKLYLLCGLICFYVSAAAPVEVRAQTPEPLAPQLKGGITATVADALEEGLKTDPDNLEAREELIQYYFMAMARTRSTDFEETREKHVFWLIEHHPESELAGSPESGIFQMGPSGTEGYQRGKQLWLQEVEKHPDSPVILRNAAEYLLLYDRKVARELLEKAWLLSPGDAETSSMLARTYEQERDVVASPDEKAALSQKAVSVREQGLEKSDAEERFYGLADLATSALQAGQIEKAQQYASELLASADKYKSNWNYGNAVHKGNIVLGLVELRREDVSGAKEHLLAASLTPGSPQLDSFGPNMTLAKELLEKGEREAVLAYLQNCEEFWKMGRGKLEEWIATAKTGGIPDFGANLSY